MNTPGSYCGVPPPDHLVQQPVRTQVVHMAQNGVDATVVPNPNGDVGQKERLKAIGEGSMRAELKHIDLKYTERRQAYYAETVEEEIPEQTDWHTKFALCIVRHFDTSNRIVLKTSLQVNSQHLKDILRETIKDFPGVSFALKDVTLDRPCRVLFHYRKELKAAAQELEAGSEAAQHLDLLLDFINEDFKDVISESENLIDQEMISYKHLWTIFRPGDTTVYTSMLGQPRALLLKSYAYICQPFPALQIQGTYVDFDGERFGTRESTVFVHAFVGAEKIASLKSHPLHFHPSAAEVKQQLLSRGRQWEQHAGRHFRSYSGVAFEDVTRYHIEGRVVIDTKTFHRFNADTAFTVAAFNAIEEDIQPRRARAGMRRAVQAQEALTQVQPDLTEPLELEHLTDEQCVIATSTVRGFSFGEKKWCDFFIENISPIEWNPQSFDKLVLPETQKDLVKALVTTHIKQGLEFDDIVKGKGKGLIFVLHGPPGVGKTLTAETVAELCKRPLFSVSSGDLGINSTVLDERLGRILDMASTWKAVLLIDEADVFLEKRSLHDMERNQLVSIFLRVLEFYSGILILTSNRVNTFDDAFKSRIHVPLKYGSLTADARKEIWKNFLGRLDKSVMVDEDDYDRLARVDINGRQIKNIVRTALSLAQFHDSRLDFEKLWHVIKIQKDFEHELDCMNGVNGAGGSGSEEADDW